MVITEKVKIINRLGVHIRSAALLVRALSQFKCRILVKNKHRNADAKSLINLLTLAAGYGSELTFIFEGEDARDACASIRDLFLNKFGEE